MYKFFRHAKKLQTGFSLIEVSISLMFAGVILGTTVLAFDGASRRSVISRNADLIASLVTDARFMYGRANRFNLLDTSEAIESGLIPERLVQQESGATPVARNAYGGEIYIEQYAGSQDYALLVFGRVPANHCVALVSAVERLMDGITVTTTTDAIPSTDSDFPIKLKPVINEMNLELLQSACEQDPELYLQFKFYKE